MQYLYPSQRRRPEVGDEVVDDSRPRSRADNYLLRITDVCGEREDGSYLVLAESAGFILGEIADSYLDTLATVTPHVEDRS